MAVDTGFGRTGWLGPRFLAWLFVLYAIPAIVFLSVAMPPFQVADEHEHAHRADQLSRGGLISHRLGGEVDGALDRLVRVFIGVHFHTEVKVTPAMASAAAALTWALPDVDENFQSTAQYGPLLYLPQAAGILSGKLIGLSPARTMVWARLINGGFAVLVGFAAMRVCRRGAALLFTTLLLPMTLSQFASLSQDALIIGLSLLAGSLGSRVIDEDRPAEAWEWAAFVAIVVATTMARPSQLTLFALAPAFLRWPLDARWRQQLVIFAVGMACLAAWLAILPQLMPAAPPDISASRQLHEIFAHPLLLPTVVFNRFQEGGYWLFETVVGYLGWTDAELHPRYYEAAMVALLCAWLAPGNRRPFLKPAAIGVASVVTMIAAISAALYATWTPVGKLVVEGLQGRYLLPVLPLLAWAAPCYGPRLAGAMSPAWIVVMFFPLRSLATLPEAIMSRYYGNWSSMGECLRLLYLN